MKKIFTLLFVILMLTLVEGCKKDETIDNENLPNEPKQLTQLTLNGEGNSENVFFIYNSQGKIARINFDDEDNLIYNYQNDRLISLYAENSIGNYWIQRFFDYDEQGRVSSAKDIVREIYPDTTATRNLSITYSGNKIAEILYENYDFFHGEITFWKSIYYWQEDYVNKKESYQKSEDGEWEALYTCLYSYDNKSNPLYLYMDELSKPFESMFLFDFPIGKNNVLNSNMSNGYSENWSYEYEGEYPVSALCISNNGATEVIYQYQ